MLLKVCTYTLVVSVLVFAFSGCPAFVDALSGDDPNDQPPVAFAGEDATYQLGQTVTLTGSGSDPDGDAVTFLWTFFDRPGSATVTSIFNSNQFQASFVPDAVGIYQVQLTVTAGSQTASDLVTITITADEPVPENQSPIADAGADVTDAVVGQSVPLDGSGSSDPDGDSLSYDWSVTDGPVGSVAEVNPFDGVTPAFIPDVAGTYEITLTVDDGSGDVSGDTVTVTAAESPPLTADAGLTISFENPTEPAITAAGGVFDNGVPVLDALDEDVLEISLLETFAEYQWLVGGQIVSTDATYTVVTDPGSIPAIYQATVFVTTATGETYSATFSYEIVLGGTQQ